MDEEIFTFDDTALMLSSPHPTETEEVAGKESEHVDIRDARKSRIHGDY